MKYTKVYLNILCSMAITKTIALESQGLTVHQTLSPNTETLQRVELDDCLAKQAQYSRK